MSFKLGFSTLGDLTWTVERFAEELARWDYSCVEIRGKQDAHIGPEDGPTRRKEVRRIFESKGIQIASVSAYSAFTDRKTHADQIAQVKTYLHLAADLGAGIIRVFGSNPVEGQTVEDSVNAVAEALTKLAPEAEKTGVVMALETHDGFCRSNIARAVIDKVGSSHVKVLWDLHHPFRHKETWSQTYANLKQVLGIMHVKDAMVLPDGREQLCLMGAGDIPVQSILKQLIADKFSGPVIVEWEKAWHPELMACDIAIPQHIHKIKQYMQEA